MMKCPLCDGPVVNGRCRDCGMPYKNDEILYHLNETRRTHEKHATDKAKEELLKRMTPLGDPVKPAAGQTKGKKKSSSSGKQKGKSNAQTVSRQSGQPYRSEKQSQMAAAKRKKEFGGSRNSSWSSEKKTRKKKSLGSLIFWLLVIWMAAGAVGPSIREVVEEWNADKAYEADLKKDDPASETEAYFSSWSGSDGKMEYGLSAGYGSIEVGEELPAGTYEIYTNSEEVTLVCEKSDTGEEKIWTLWEGETITQPLKKGDVLELLQDSDSYESVYFKEVYR